MKTWALAAAATFSFAACGSPGAKDPGDAETGGAASGGSPASSGGAPSSGGTTGGGGSNEPKTTRLYVGGGDWSDEGHGKLSVFTFDEAAATFTPGPTLDVGQLNSFAAFAPTSPYLYVADEAGKMLRSFSIDGANGALSQLDETPTTGGPVYVSVDSTGKYALVAYYGEGQVEVFALGADGSLGASVDTENTGDAAHSIVLSPDGRFAFVCNKDSNSISQFQFDATTGQLAANSPASVTRAGGPRHLAFHPNGQFAYVINELAGTMTAFAYDEDAGTLSELETESAVEVGFAGTLAAADVHVSGDGKYLYGSNRSGDASSLALFSIGTDGRLEPQQTTSTHGKTPRNFQLAPAGDVLVVANQDSNQLAQFRLGATGELTFSATTEAGTAPYWIGFRVFD